MLKLCGITFITLLSIVCNSPAHAQQIQLTLDPNESKVFENNYLWSVNATCTIACGESNHKILVRLVKNKGMLNGRALSKEHDRSLVVHNHDSISVQAEPGTKVNLLNVGHESVQANCSA